MQTVKQAIFAQVAKAKLVYVKNKDTYKVVIAFNVTEQSVNGKYKFPVQSKCNYVSGDLCADTLQKDIVNVITNAKKALRTDNIVFVD